MQGGAHVRGALVQGAIVPVVRTPVAPVSAVFLVHHPILNVAFCAYHIWQGRVLGTADWVFQVRFGAVLNKTV